MLDMGFQESVEEILAASYTKGLTIHECEKFPKYGSKSSNFPRCFARCVCRKPGEASNIIFLRNSPGMG